ncbi:aspartate-semialdehyde dehydrogenase [Evansella vedderi]|uniref:Aspartate-semialdehyde dehydrogenase n=1 Tax=Evansella vedderi TaxID=38282 RepID=A0ABT9ZW11_9BACI|nr:hypothetical protein [Evansella vedderi]MDQ0255419.1 aspartate-semialdehyde dehydrogenase [Evansella vedderi]
MTQDNKAINKMAQRVIEGYEAVHNKDFQRAKQLLEPISPLLHQEDKPNITFLCYLAISQIGSKDIDPFLDTYEELQKYEIKNNKEQALKDRVEEMFHELMSAFQQTEQGE